MKNLSQLECLEHTENSMTLRRNIRSERVKAKVSEKNGKSQKGYKLIGIFFVLTADNEMVKNDIKSILRMELQQQINPKN